MPMRRSCFGYERRMRFLKTAAIVAALTIAALAPASAAVKAGTQTFEGTLVHVSSDNLKVMNPSATMTFLLVPRFGAVFSKDGSKSMQMKDLHSGETVKVYYDQKFLGRPHADRVLILNAMEHRVGGMHG